MVPFGTNYDPGKVMFGSAKPGSPYINPSPARPGTPPLPAPPRISKPPATVPPQTGFLGANSIRATGPGPFDPAYRQNLATYTGGQFSNPGGGPMSFNPTNPGNFGLPSGGGNAPLFGMPNTLLGSALGGQGFSWAPPTTNATVGGVQPPQFGDTQFWLDQFLQNGGGKREQSS